MVREYKVNSKVFQKVVAGMEKSEIIHPSGEEKESFDLFKCMLWHPLIILFCAHLLFWMGRVSVNDSSSVSYDLY